MVFFLYNDNPPIHVVRYALHHDAAEVITGDVPATAKWNHASLAKGLNEAEKKVSDQRSLTTSEDLTTEELALVKYADMMDLCFKSVEEMACGNDIFSALLTRGLLYAKTLLNNPLKDHAPAHALYQLLMNNRYITIEEHYEQSAETAH
jgi:5'-deoxynucleotidase YfbR-like HD superfamily hydrolase